jgi:hypothetical protein
MVPRQTVTLAPDLYEAAKRSAEAEGKTIDELAAEALKRELARRWVNQTRRDAEIRRGSMTDEEVEAVIERAVRETRAESGPADLWVSNCQFSR